MKLLAFTKRNFYEIIRDPLNLAFGIGFPIVILLLLSLINSNIPADPQNAAAQLFSIEHLTPGIAIFGLSFISLFSAVLISKDRSGSFMHRLFTSPMRASDYILGYTLPLIPLSIAQSLVCYATAIILGLPVSVNIIYAILLVVFPSSLLFIGVGLLCGSLLNDKQVGGVCGALLTNLTAWLSGTWFDVSMVGGVFSSIANALPFIHAVDAGRAILAGNISGAFPDLFWVIGYAIVMVIISIIVFTKKMSAD